MSINNLREYTSAYPKTLGPLWRYYRDKPALKNNSNITDFPANHNNSISLKFKQYITGQAGNSGTKMLK